MKKVFYVLIALVVLFVGVSFLLPSEVTVERTTVVKASVDVVFDQVNDLKKWNEWSPWAEMDPNTKYEFSENTSGEGAYLSWSSEHENVGNGKMSITESVPFSEIKNEMNFMEEGSADAYWKFNETTEGTEVVWGFHTDLGGNPIMRYMGLMFDGMIGKDYEKGLNNLKVRVENIPAPEAEEETTTEETSESENIEEAVETESEVNS